MPAQEAAPPSQDAGRPSKSVRAAPKNAVAPGDDPSPRASSIVGA